MFPNSLENFSAVFLILKSDQCRESQLPTEGPQISLLQEYLHSIFPHLSELKKGKQNINNSFCTK